MKKLMMMCATILMTISLLAGCEVPEGMSEEFYYDACALFHEIDEDTMEMESSDQDDLANLDLLDARAITDREQAFIREMIKLTELQKRVIQRDKSALKEYIKTRHHIGQILEISPMKFEFTEED
jgi:hypothetical protein